LAKLRETEAIFRERWTKDEDGWRKLPPRSWPAYQPPAEKIPSLEVDLLQCPKNAGAPLSQDCAKAHFDYATALVFASVDPPRGLERYTELAEGGNVDGMVAAGVTLVEGNGVPTDEEAGIRWLRKASDLDCAQAHYELGTMLYLGEAVEEDEEGAVALFKRAAAKQHAAGMFMLGDCMLEGEGCQREPGRAVPLLYAAAEMGHRGARQHIRQLLDGTWHGFRGKADVGPVLTVP
jgi:TPR repeat protein